MNRNHSDGVQEVKAAQAERMERARRGDMEAFAEAFEPLRGMAFAVAVRLVGESDADDVVMNAFLKAWQALPQFRGGSSLKTWLYRITRNCALDMIRSRQRRRESSLTWQDSDQAEVQVEDESQPRPDAEMERAETVAEVQQALDALPELHRTILLMRYSDDLAYHEMAAALGISIGTVMSRIYNAKRKLRKIMEASP